MDDKSPIGGANTGGAQEPREPQTSQSSQRPQIPGEAPAEPRKGDGGGRSLDAWQRLAATRKALAGSSEAAERLADDPAGVLRQLGLDDRFLSVFLPQEPDERFPAPAPIDAAAGPQGGERDEDEHEHEHGHEHASGEHADSHGGGQAQDGAGDAVVRKSGRISLRVV